LARRENIKTDTKSILKFSFIFLAIFAFSFFYQKYLLDNARSDILYYLVNSLNIIIFILTIYRAKIGLYVFIFLIPLLNSLPKILGVPDISVILLLFFSLGLGFIISIFKNTYEKRQFIDERNKWLRMPINRAILLLIILIGISSLIVVYRYTNFYPFITNGYYDLYVNVNKVGSTGSIFWTIQYFLNYIVGFLFLFIVINTFKNFKEILTAVIILLSSTMISVFIGFYQYFFNPLFGNISFWLEMNRINATFTDPNSLGTYSLMVLPLFVCLIFFSRKWFIKLIVGLLFVSFLINMFFSGSRTAFIGLLISSAIFIIIGLWKAVEKLNMRFKKPARYKKVLLWLFTVVIIVVLLLSILNFLPAIFKKAAPYNVLLGRVSLALDKLNTAFKNKDWEAISMISRDREILWKQAVYMFKDHPISGVGAGAYVIELPNYYIKSGMAGYRNSLVDYCGNYYLQFLSELGLPGLLLILFIFFIIIKKAFTYFKSQNYISGLKGYNWLIAGLFISFISMIIALIFGPHTNFNEIQFTFWLIIGLMLTFITIKENKREVLTINESDIIKSNFIGKISLSIFILIFAVSTAIGSFTNLSINIKQNLYGYMNRWGYYDYQKELINDNSYRGYRRLTTITSDIVEKKGQVMFFSIKAGDPDVYKDDIYIRFYIDNSFAKIARLKDDDWHYIELSIPHTERDKIAFTVCVSRSLVPKNWNVPQYSKDPGIMITDIDFKNNKIK